MYCFFTVWRQSQERKKNAAKKSAEEKKQFPHFKNDTTAGSDKNSLQNFSYYGRRFAQVTRNSELSPSSEHDVMATSMDKFTKKVDDAKNLKTASFQN